MSHPETLPDSPRCISSPASADGVQLSDLQGCQTALESGLEALLASLSPRQAKAAGLMTSGTYGRTSTTSSASASLESSLVNSLRARTQMLGSTLYKLTWKAWAMPSGRSRFRLRGSVLRTSATAATGSVPTPWPTPQARDFKGAPLAGIHDRGVKGAPLNETARLASWGTPTSCDSNRKPAHDFTTKNLTLNHGAALASWPTPTLQDHNHREGPRPSRAATGRTSGYLTEIVPLASWPTPRAADGLKGAHQEAQTNLKGTDLPTTASWTMDCPARLTVTGQLLIGSDAGMASGGQLNPAHSRWLMGYPAAWDSCGATAMQSISTPRRPSSKRSKTT